MLLVTGATGYVGGAALRLLSTLRGSRSVVGLARNAESAAVTTLKGTTYRIADYNRICRAMRRKIWKPSSRGTGIPWMNLKT
jgi:NADPH:quinone reductase-like Zn-dependent oxidoreductase